MRCLHLSNWARILGVTRNPFVFRVAGSSHIPDTPENAEGFRVFLEIPIEPEFRPRLVKDYSPPAR